MVTWQRSITRQPAKTKVELREMLTEAVRNTRASPDQAETRVARAQKTATIVVRAD